MQLDPLVPVLNQRAIKFGMRVDNTDGFACVRDFMRSDANERIVMLRAPDKQDAIDYECPRKPQRVRLVRNVLPTGHWPAARSNDQSVRRPLYQADWLGESNTASPLHLRAAG